MVVLLKRFCQKKLVNSTLIFLIASSFIAVKFVHADEKKADRQTFKGIIDHPLTETSTATIGHLEIENGFERSFLYTLYQIGGKSLSRQGYTIYHFPISELKFPLDAYFFYFNLNINFLNRLTIHYSMHKNINNRVSKMKDSDWVPFPKVKTIYSESDARLNAVFNESDLAVRLFTVSFFSLDLGAGFMHQYLYYWCSNVEQVSIYDTSSPIYIGNPQYVKLRGKIITYKLQYYIFTMQITPVFKIPIGTGFLEIVTAIRFSPYLKAKDIDDHILRGKISKSESTGTAFMPFLKIIYTFYNRIFITAKFEYLYLTTEGKQQQYYYNPFLDSNSDKIPGWYASLQCKLKSEQISISLGAGYSFEF
jgi:hypothetical protein